MPDLSAVRFRNFRLGLGPDLQVRMPPLISFRGGGQLLVNGPLDPSLELRGLIRLNRGRVSLFSTTFRLDPRAPNVAVFTPSLGLVPFIDIAMKTRVSDAVQPGTAGNASSANVFDTNGLGDGGGQLRLVKVSVEAAGPADRLIGNLDLRSVPPMSQPQLLALIGGNSLSGLAGAGGAALATVLGQSLLSPVLGTLTDAMGQRLQIALFPTYVTPDIKDEDERRSGRVAPTFTLVTEIGVDVTDRFDFSVLAAPNTSDVPPQATVTYQVTPNTALSGSVDSNGIWQSQLQLFFRF
jgi:translocation and assembly module TamB